MAKRRYVRPKSDKPKPLRSNWPDLDNPNEPDYTLDTTVQAREPDTKPWEYIIYQGDRKIAVYKDKDKAKRILNSLRKQKGKKLWLHSHEPSSKVAHNVRQQEKADWRWNAGFGA